MLHLALTAFLTSFPALAGSEPTDLKQAMVVTRGEKAPVAEQTAATVLIEEVEKRTGVRWPKATALPAKGPAIVVSSALDNAEWSKAAPQELRNALSKLRPEGYCLFTGTGERKQPIFWIVGADSRGALFGVGQLLRRLEMLKATVRLDRPLEITTSPAYPIRGHQLGFRNTANSYDAWDA